MIFVSCDLLGHHSLPLCRFPPEQINRQDIEGPFSGAGARLGAGHAFIHQMVWKSLAVSREGAVYKTLWLAADQRKLNGNVW